MTDSKQGQDDTPHTMTRPVSSLDFLPPGSPEDPHSLHLVSAASSAPNFGFLYRPVGLSQREEDALRIHVLLMFYDDHALLWSSLEQHFHALDEKRLNSAIALLEELDDIEVEPAPAPNPWSPDDALVRLLPHPAPFAYGKQQSTYDPTLPLPWPGSHVYSPVVPETPGPPAFGFPVLLSENEYHAEVASEFPFPGSVSAGAAAFSSGRGRRKSGPGSRGSTLPSGLIMSQAAGGLQQGAQTPRATSTTTPSNPVGGGYATNVPQTFDVLHSLRMTVTPPSSDRWMSEENTPYFGPVSDREQGWMHKRLGQAMSGVDFLDLDQDAEPADNEKGTTEALATTKDSPSPTKKLTLLPATSDIHSLSLAMDDTLDIVKNAIAAQAAVKAASARENNASPRTESKKGRERLGVSFANADEINEFHAYPTAGQNSGLDVHDEGSDEEQGHAKTPIANPAGGWMRRLEKAYSYG